MYAFEFKIYEVFFQLRKLVLYWLLVLVKHFGKYNCRGNDPFCHISSKPACRAYVSEMPMDAEIIKDPLTGKVYMKTKSGRLMEIKGDVDVFVDPKTGKTYVMQKGLSLL